MNRYQGNHELYEAQRQPCDLTVQDYFNQTDEQEKLQKILGEKSQSFTLGVIEAVSNNEKLKSVSPQSVFTASCVSAMLGLQINATLGHAYLVPFKGKAQFQIGYKGFVQLALRSGEFKSICACATYSEDTDADVFQRLTSLIPKNQTGCITGYVAYFELLNGYIAHHKMTIEELNSHALKYSQTFQRGFGVWKDNFEAMAKKTVIKLLLSKQAPLSIDSPLSLAGRVDQSVINDVDARDYQYPDNEPLDVTPQQPQIINKKSLTNEQFDRAIQIIKTTGVDKKGNPMNKQTLKLDFKLTDNQLAYLMSA